MKKIISFLLCAIIACTCSLSAFAKNETINSSEEKEVIEFIYEEEISEELKAKIENHLLNGGEQNTRGLGCVLFGHDLITTTTIKITHKAKTSTPRCLEEVYEVQTCEDCDYVKSTLLDSTYIYCCS